VAIIISQDWPASGRHNLRLAYAKLLHEHGIPEPRIIAILQAVMEATGSDVNDVAPAVQSTIIETLGDEIGKVAAGEDADVAKLKLQLAEAQSATAAATQERDALVHRSAVSAAFLAAGGRPEAVDYIVGKAPFAIVDGELKPKAGEPSPTITEWLLDQAAGPHAFAFHRSTGGGAPGAKAPTLALGPRANVKMITNPSPQELGEHASAIAAGSHRATCSDA
jgi:hypothetical protein